MTIDSSSWRLVLGLRVLVCIVVPLVSVLPLAFSVRRPNVASALAVLLVGTAIPVVVGVPSALDLARGPRDEIVTVVLRERQTSSVKHRVVASSRFVIRLADGRTLRADENVALPPLGTCELSFLPATERILGVTGAQITPRATIACATRKKPATLAPTT